MIGVLRTRQGIALGYPVGYTIALSLVIAIAMLIVLASGATLTYTRRARELSDLAEDLAGHYSARRHRPEPDTYAPGDAGVLVLLLGPSPAGVDEELAHATSTPALGPLPGSDGPMAWTATSCGGDVGGGDGGGGGCGGGGCGGGG